MGYHPQADRRRDYLKARSGQAGSGRPGWLGAGPQPVRLESVLAGPVTSYGAMGGSVGAGWGQHLESVSVRGGTSRRE